MGVIHASLYCCNIIKLTEYSCSFYNRLLTTILAAPNQHHHEENNPILNRFSILIF